MSINLELDLTGRLVTNRLGYPLIIRGMTTPTMGEVLTTPYGLFHGNVTVIKSDTKEPLTFEEDYTLGLPDSPTFNETGISAYRNIVILNQSLLGKVDLYANYLGGKYTTPSNQDIPELISLALLTKRAITWETLPNRPLTKPPVDHPVLGGDITTGAQSITGAMWRAWVNRREVGPELIYAVANGVLKSMQVKDDPALQTVSKTIPESINELYLRATHIFGGGGTRLPYLGTVSASTGVDLSVAMDGYYLVGDENEGLPILITGMFSDGTSAKTLESGSVLGVLGGKLEDITLIAGPYGLADVVGGELYGEMVDVQTGINRLHLLAQPNTGLSSSKLKVDTDLTGLSKASSFICVSDISVRGRWANTTWVSSRLVKAGSVLKFAPATGLTVTADKPNREDLGDLPITSARLTTKDKTVVGSLEEVLGRKGLLDYASGDLITVVKGTPMPSKAVKAGSSPVSRTEFPNLFGLWSTTYGVGDGINTFGVPKTPSLGGSLLTVLPSSVEITPDRYFFTGPYVWVFSVSPTEITQTQYLLSDRSTSSPVAITEHLYGNTVKLLGVIGDNLYLLGDAGSGTKLIGFNLVTYLYTELADATGVVAGETDWVNDLVYLIGTSSISTYNITTLVTEPVITGIAVDGLNDTALSITHNVLYLATDGGLVKVDVSHGTLLTIDGSQAINVCVAEDRDLVVSQTSANGRCLRFGVIDDLEVESSTSVGLVTYHQHQRCFRSLIPDSFEFLSVVDETPIYEYYFKE